MSENLAWAAGFFDGEGSICLSNKKQRNGKDTYTAPRLSITQNERELLDRFRDAVGIGRVYGPYARRACDLSKNPVYQYGVWRRDDIVRVIEMLRPWLGSRKLAQADAALTI